MNTQVSHNSISGPAARVSQSLDTSRFGTPRSRHPSKYKGRRNLGYKKISIIGTGHIGTALFRGFLNGGLAPENFVLVNPDINKLHILQKKFGVKLTMSNKEAVETSDIIIIAVRPKLVAAVIREVLPFVRKDQIIISVAACVPISLLKKYFQNKTFKIARIMPNIPVTYGKGVVGWLGNTNMTTKDKLYINNLLSRLGIVIDCKSDEMLEKVSVLAGCATGYVTYFMENLEDKAVNYGFSREEAHKIVLSVFAGTVYHLQKTGKIFDEVMQTVATPGGITEEILRSLDESGFPEIFKKSLDNGYVKIKMITKELTL